MQSAYFQIKKRLLLAAALGRVKPGLSAHLTSQNAPLALTVVLA